MTSDVAIDAFTEEDLEPLRTLFASYFAADDRLLTADYNRWLYGSNPFGPALMVKVLDGARWVGFMAMVPVQLQKSTQKLQAYFVVNVLVHPEFHGKHLFGRMIKAAMVNVEHEGAALLGHPNDMAHKAWQRARMHFQDELRPSLAIPSPLGLFGIGCKIRRLESAAQLEALRQPLMDVLAGESVWRVAVTPEYLDWRFLQHPTIKYRLDRIEDGGSVLGLQITKRLRPGVSMLIDQYVPSTLRRAACARLPLVTLAMLPQRTEAAGGTGMYAMPLKKRIPFFFTRPTEKVNGENSAWMGLSASDF